MGKIPKSIQVSKLRRNKTLVKNMGLRELDILMKKGARVKSSDLGKGYYDVVNGNRSFSFAYGASRHSNYKIVG